MAVRITIGDRELAVLASKFGRPKAEVFQLLFEHGRDPQKVEDGP